MNWNNFDVILFDLGDTLIYQQVDSQIPLDRLKLALLPSVKEMLRYARQKCELGIVSNTELSTESVVRRGLERLSIASFFKSVTTSVDVGLKKPGKDIFFTALSKHHCEPKRSIMVGNNYAEDIVPAREIGMTTILVQPSGQEDGKTTDQANYVVQNIEELYQLFLASDEK